MRLVLEIVTSINFDRFGGLCEEGKPLLSNKNIQACSHFAKSHKIWIVVDWKEVVFLI